MTFFMCGVVVIVDEMETRNSRLNNKKHKLHWWGIQVEQCEWIERIQNC